MRPSFILGLLPWLALAVPPEPKFRIQEIDKVDIGYGLAIADVDGDGKPDIILADQKTVQWYHNPDWKKHIIARNLTKLDNVCVAAQVVNGHCEIAVGAGWNPSDTVGSGAVFYLQAPADPTQLWEAIPLPYEPTVHRMHWVQINSQRWDLVVQPLHGRGNKNTAVPLSGFFGAVELDAFNMATVSVEHDGTALNAGLRLAPLPGLSVNLGTIRKQHITTYGLSYTYPM